MSSFLTSFPSTRNKNCRRDGHQSHVEMDHQSSPGDQGMSMLTFSISCRQKGG